MRNDAKEILDCPPELLGLLVGKGWELFCRSLHKAMIKQVGASSLRSAKLPSPGMKLLQMANRKIHESFVERLNCYMSVILNSKELLKLDAVDRFFKENATNIKNYC